jgi:glycine/D-amino acid oxidase-like deaminating enzyme
MRVAVLGGGMQGCCCALALAARGARVTIYDRNDRLLSRAAIANEGKIHLGYMYANDPSLSTARTMMRGALSFGPFLARHLEIGIGSIAVSEPASYVVHRESQRDAAAVETYLESVHRLILEAACHKGASYFGRDFSRPPRRWSEAERAAAFDPAIAVAAFDSGEVAVNPVWLADALRERVRSDPAIETRLEHEVAAVEDSQDPVVNAKGPSGETRAAYDCVVNALWEGRLAVDATLGLGPKRPWLHRLKYGVSFRLPKGVANPPSATFVSGPFGEVVTYPDGLIYLTWYPVCLAEISSDVTPPAWPTYPGEPQRTRLLTGTFQSMSTFVSALHGIDAADLTDVTVRGGAIVAWGATDIYDTSSELHRRYEIGVTTHGRYHSVDPGKLTMAPYFAQRLADRIFGDDEG